MKKFKILNDYNLIYIGKEYFNNCYWYHCILINNFTKEVELILDYKLDDEERFYNLRTIPIRDFIQWNIGNKYKYIEEIINECNNTISKFVEKMEEYKNESK